MSSSKSFFLAPGLGGGGGARAGGEADDEIGLDKGKLFLIVGPLSESVSSVSVSVDVSSVSVLLLSPPDVDVLFTVFFTRKDVEAETGTTGAATTGTLDGETGGDGFGLGGGGGGED